MDSVIYSASPLGAFSSSLIYIGIFFLIGFGNMLILFLTRKPHKKWRAGDYVLAVLSVFLVLVGAAMALATYNTYQNGDVTVQVEALEKREATVKCGKYYCTEYSVETTDGGKLYVFGLEKDTWEKMEVSSCYQFTYYPLKPLLADYLKQEDAYPDLYELTGYITRIELVDCSS